MLYSRPHCVSINLVIQRRLCRRRIWKYVILNEVKNLLFRQVTHDRYNTFEKWHCKILRFAQDDTL